MTSRGSHRGGIVGRMRGRGRRGSRRCSIPASRTRRLLIFGGLSAATQHLHVRGYDFGGPAIRAVLSLPFAGLETALHIDLRSLAQVFRRDFAHAREHYDAVPLGALLLLSCLSIPPGIGGSDANIGDGAAAWHITGFRVGAQMTDEHYLIETFGHCYVFLFGKRCWERVFYDGSVAVPDPTEWDGLSEEPREPSVSPGAIWFIRLAMGCGRRLVWRFSSRAGSVGILHGDGREKPYPRHDGAKDEYGLRAMVVQEPSPRQPTGEGPQKL